MAVRSYFLITLFKEIDFHIQSMVLKLLLIVVNSIEGQLVNFFNTPLPNNEYLFVLDRSLIFKEYHQGCFNSSFSD